MADKDYHQISGTDEDNAEAEDKLQEIDKVCEMLSELLKPRQATTSNSEPRYVISVAARMVGVEAHTLRYYERLGLIQPCRSGGNTRLYSQDDVEQLCGIKGLMSDLGINLAGVEVALHLIQRMKEVQRQVEEMEARMERFMGTNADSDIGYREA